MKGEIMWSYILLSSINIFISVFLGFVFMIIRNLTEPEDTKAKRVLYFINALFIGIILSVYVNITKQSSQYLVVFIFETGFALLMGMGTSALLSVNGWSDNGK